MVVTEVEQTSSVLASISTGNGSDIKWRSGVGCSQSLHLWSQFSWPHLCIFITASPVVCKTSCVEILYEVPDTLCWMRSSPAYLGGLQMYIPESPKGTMIHSLIE